MHWFGFAVMEMMYYRYKGNEIYSDKVGLLIAEEDWQQDIKTQIYCIKFNWTLPR